MRSTRWGWHTAAAMAVALAAVPAAAQYQKGDVFASLSGGLVNEYRADGTLVQTLNTGLGGYTTGSAFDAAGNFYVTDFSRNAVSKFDNGGTLLGTFGSGYNIPESIVFNRTGSVYVGNVGGGIRQFTAGGTLVQAFATGRVDWMDLAADQRTMYFTTEGTAVERYDLSTQTLLSPFASGLTGGNAFALRILGNGNVLVADNGDVVQLDGTGGVVRTYTVGGVNGFFSLNLDPDGTSFWSGSFNNANLYKFDIATGAIEQTIDTGAGANSLFGVSVFGEITQGGPMTTPEPGTVALVAAGLIATGAAVRRRRGAAV